MTIPVGVMKVATILHDVTDCLVYLWAGASLGWKMREWQTKRRRERNLKIYNEKLEKLRNAHFMQVNVRTKGLN